MTEIKLNIELLIIAIILVMKRRVRGIKPKKDN